MGCANITEKDTKGRIKKNILAQQSCQAALTWCQVIYNLLIYLMVSNLHWFVNSPVLVINKLATLPTFFPFWA